jgi:hypothetical protein
MSTNSILVGTLVAIGLLMMTDAARAAQATAEAKSVAVRSESPAPSDAAATTSVTVRKVSAEQPKSDAGTETRDNGQASRLFETHAAKRVTIYNVGV